MLNNTEILKVAEVVSQEKGIEQDIVMEALEESFELIGKAKYGMDSALEEAVKKHINSFYNADVYSYFGKVFYGHRAGEYVWINGPMQMNF